MNVINVHGEKVKITLARIWWWPPEDGSFYDPKHVVVKEFYVILMCFFNKYLHELVTTDAEFIDARFNYENCYYYACASVNWIKLNNVHVWSFCLFIISFLVFCMLLHCEGLSLSAPVFPSLPEGGETLARGVVHVAKTGRRWWWMATESRRRCGVLVPVSQRAVMCHVNSSAPAKRPFAISHTKPQTVLYGTCTTHQSCFTLIPFLL